MGSDLEEGIWFSHTKWYLITNMADMEIICFVQKYM